MNARPPAAIRPRRSVLYVPGSNARAIDKARQLPCDAVILDLEDAVAPKEKEEALQAALKASVEKGKAEKKNARKKKAKKTTTRRPTKTGSTR